MKSLHDLTTIAAFLIRDEAAKLSISDVRRDIATLDRRVENEGLRFLTVTLADFGKALLASLEEGRLNEEMLTGFRKASRHSRLPAFLQGWTRHIFSDKGEVLGEVSVDHLRSLRFICQAFSKVRFPFTKEQAKANEAQYIATDAALLQVEIPESLLECYRKITKLIVTDLGNGIIDEEEFFSKLKFGNGPGAVAEKGILGDAKYNTLFRTWSDRLQEVFPYEEYGACNYRELSDEMRKHLGSSSPSLDPADPAGRLVFVPKTCKGPRTICIEPAANQFIQQGIKNFLYERIESAFTTQQSINFGDQSINQHYARLGSFHPEDWATLDLSEASDRVSLEAVHYLFESHPVLYRAVMASRTTRVILPSGSEMRVNKFASMGSALCFPVEALVFYSIIQATLHMEAGLAPTPDSIAAFSGSVLVYGDDIVVPTDKMGVVVSSLTAFGLKVNTAKSFGKSRFRESCGSEWYNGQDLRPVYLRENPFDPYESPAQLASFFSFVHQLHERGNDAVVDVLRRWFTNGKVLPGLPAHLRVQPTVPAGSGVIGWPSYLPIQENNKVYYDDRLQKAYIKCYRISRKGDATISGWRRLFRWFCETQDSGLRTARSRSDQFFGGSDASSVKLERSRDWSRQPTRKEPLSLRRGRLYVN